MANSQYGASVVLQNNSGSAAASAAPSGGVFLFSSGSQGNAKLFINKEGSQTDVEVGAGLTISDGDNTDTVTLGSDTLLISGSAQAISASVTNNQVQMHLDINKLVATTAVADSDLVVIDDGANGTIRKMTRAHFIESAALDAINIDGGAIDGTAIGANAQAAGQFTSLSGSGKFNAAGAAEFSRTLGVSGSATFASSVSVEGSVDLGNATSDTITATGRFDSDLVPSTDSARALGSSALQWSAIHVDVGHVDQLGSALDANNQAITNVDINSGAIDNTAIGATTPRSGEFTFLSASHDFHAVGSAEFASTLGVSGSATFASSVSIEGNVDLGNATSDIITATGRFNSNIVPASDSANALGTSDLQWAAVHVDVGHIDQLGSALDANSQAITNINVDSGAVDGITLGTNSAVTNAVMTIMTASHARITNLDAVTINSVSQTESTLEVKDKLIVASLSASSANSAGGGLRVGGGAGAEPGHASILYDHGNTALDFNIKVSGAEVTQVRIEDGAILPETNNDIDLGSDDNEFKDLYIDGVAYLDEVDIDAGAIDGAVIGANQAAAGTFTTLVAGGNVDLGDATSDTITATGRFDSDLVPSTDSARALGTSALQWSAVHVDVGHIDQLGSALNANNQAITNVDINSGAIDNTAIGATTPRSGEFTFLSASHDFHAVGSAEFASTLGVTGSATFASTLSGSGAVTFASTTTVGDKILPLNDGLVDLGSNSQQWKDIYINGKAYIDQLGEALDCDNQNMTNVDIDSGAIDGTAIGAASQSTGKFTHLSASGDFHAVGSAEFASTLGVSGSATFASTVSGSGAAQFGSNISMFNGALLLKAGSAASGIGNDSGQPVMGITSGQNAAFQANLAVNSQLSCESFVLNSGYGSGGASISSAGAASFAGNTEVGTAGASNGANFTAHGNAAGEKAHYANASNIFQVTGSSASGLRVNIGGNSTSTFAIEVANGSNNNNKIKAAAFVTYSDESLKQDVSSMANTALDTVMSLEGVEFTWKDSGERDFGFIAQDVQSVLPNAVHAGDDGIHGVDYSRLTSVLVEAVKAQQVQIEDLKKTITKLKK